MKRFAKTLHVFAILPFLAAPAMAAGDGGGSSDKTPTCETGKVWDKDKNKCVPKTSALDDESIYEYGRDLAYAGRYDEAIDVLTLAHDKTDARILNFLGYAHRKSGRIEVGLGYYQEAIRNDPNYTLVREYLGEAYLQLGDIASARGQLTEIKNSCGVECREYSLLARQIDVFVKG